MDWLQIIHCKTSVDLERKVNAFLASSPEINTRVIDMKFSYFFIQDVGAQCIAYIHYESSKQVIYPTLP